VEKKFLHAELVQMVPDYILCAFHPHCNLRSFQGVEKESENNDFAQPEWQHLLDFVELILRVASNV